MPGGLKDQFPLRLIVGSEDLTFLLDNGFTFSSVDPGGFEMASFQVPKDMPQTLRGQPVRLDCGLRVAFEGRVSQIQRSLGSRTTITCEGNAAVLKDREASMVFVDRDLTRWQGPSVQRQINSVSASQDVDAPQIAADATTGKPSVQCSLTGPWSRAHACEAYYDAGPGNVIGSIYYAWNVNANMNPNDANWNWAVYLSSDDVLTSTDNSGNLANHGNTSGSGTLAATLSNRRFALLDEQYAVAAGSSGLLYAIYWNSVAVYGNHGLTLRGAAPSGLYASDIVGWLLTQLAALQAGNMPPGPTGYIIPHYVQYVPVGLDQILDDMSKIAGWHWGVWESLSPLTGSAKPRLDFAPRPSPGAFTASCYRRDCDEIDLREDLANMYNQAVINFTDPAGKPGSVTVTADNPVLDQAGIAQRTVTLNAGTMVSAAATVFGQIVLALLYQQNRVAGTIQATGPIRDAAGGPMPAWLLKPGVDRLRVIDLPSVDAFGSMSDVPLTRMECSGSSSGFQTTLDVGQGGNLVETLQSRLAAASVVAGQGA